MGADDNYVTDAQLVVIGNTSGTNSGDNAANSTADMLLGTVQAVTAEKKFTNSKLTILGSSTGKNTFTMANAGASDFITTVPAVTGTVALGTGTANEIAYWSATNVLGTLAVATYPSLTELSYVKGLSSAVQTQLNAKITNTVTTLDSLTSAATLPWTGMADGTDGQIPTFDAAGAPAFVATGNAGQVLTSNGAGTAPTFNEPTYQYVEVNISSANIVAMYATPVQVIAGEAGKIPIIIQVLSSFTYGGTQYTGGGLVSLREETSGEPLCSLQTAAQMLGTADVHRDGFLNQFDNSVNRTSGKGIFISNSIGAFATGNGTIKLRIFYKMVTL